MTQVVPHVEQNVNSFASTQDVIEEMEDVVYPALTIPRPDNPVYSENDLLMVETVTALKQDAANSGAEIHSD